MMAKHRAHWPQIIGSESSSRREDFFSAWARGQDSLSLRSPGSTALAFLTGVWLPPSDFTANPGLGCPHAFTADQ